MEKRRRCTIARITVLFLASALTVMKMMMAMRKLQNDTKTNKCTLDVTDYRHMHCDAENDDGDHAGDDEDNSR